MNERLLDAWRRIANDTAPDAPPVIKIARTNIAELVDEIDRLTAENQRLQRTRPDRPA